MGLQRVGHDWTSKHNTACGVCKTKRSIINDSKKDDKQKKKNDKLKMHVCQLITSYKIISRKTKRRFGLIPKVINSNYVRKKKGLWDK